VSVGMIFYVIALILAFLAGTGIVSIPGAVFWVLFAMTLGLILERVALPTGKA
jgi:hypothetical protein